VRKFQLTAAVAAGLLVTGFLVYSVVAQQPAGPGAAGPPASGGIVLLDVNSVFKENDHFKALRAEMERDVARAEEAFKKERENLKQMAEVLKETQSSAPDYRAKEEEFTRRSTDFNVKMQLQRKEFLQQESRIYWTVYQEIQQEVDYVAQNNGFAMVLRFSNDPVDHDKPDDILREINKQVVWNARPLDITPFIKKRLADRYGAGRPAAPVGPAARPGVPFNR